MDDITVKLGLDTSPFATALRGVAGMVKTYGSALGGLLGFGGIAATGKLLIDYASRLGDTAEQLGVTTKYLQEFGFAALQNGASLEQASTALEKLNRLIGEANSGTESAKQTFKELGISLTNADGSLRTTESIMGAIADVFAKTESATEKARLANDLFGKGLAGLIPTLNNGKKGLEELAAAAKIAIILPENIKTIKTFGDALAAVVAIGKGTAGNWLGNRLAQLQKEMDAFVEHLYGRKMPVNAPSAGGSGGTGKPFPKLSLAQQIALKSDSDKLADAIRANDAEALLGNKKVKALEAIYDLKKKEFMLETDNAKAGDRILAVENARNNVIKERMSMAERLRDLNLQAFGAVQARNNAAGDLATAQGDQSRFTLHELAGMRGQGAFGREAEGAREVEKLERWSKESRQMNLPGRADALQAKADKLRASLTNLTSSERNPFAALQETAKKTEEHLRSIDLAAKGEGLMVIEIGGNKP